VATNLDPGGFMILRMVCFAMLVAMAGCDAPDPVPLSDNLSGDDFHALGTCQGSPGGSNYCGPGCPCPEGVGDCDSDAECAAGLNCAHNVGAHYGYPADVDVCQSVCSRVGDPDFDCSPECPCEENEGDCDEDADCGAGLWCLFDGGPSYGYSDPEMDVCVAGCPALGSGAENFCSATCPCAITEADCDSDAECEAGLECVRNVGAQYGYAADVDVCLPNSSTPVCGNLAVETGEVCDDGNQVDGDGCDADCVPTIADFSVGETHTCIVTRAGQLKCWGFDMWVLGYDLPGRERALGDDETLDTVGYVPLDTPVRQVLARYGHTCVITDTGAVRCWGNNQYGYLGYGHRNHPVFAWEAGDIDLGGNAVQLAGGYSDTCALLDTGAVRCWGANYHGQLGHGHVQPIGDDETPASAGDVPLGGRAVQIAAGQEHVCALLDTGDVKCWGGAFTEDDDEPEGYVPWGVLGYGNVEHIGDDETPATVGPVPLGGRAVQISTGLHSTCALLDTGAVRCWGYYYGLLSYGALETVGDDETPAEVGDVSLGGRAVQISSHGNWHRCAVLDTGALRCWGRNQSGQLGLGNKIHIGDNELPSTAPTVNMGAGVIDVAAGGSNTCALLNHGGLRCWGDGNDGGHGYGHELMLGDNESPASLPDLPLW
jgi:cysteine-rich repeat protein